MIKNMFALKYKMFCCKSNDNSKTPAKKPKKAATIEKEPDVDMESKEEIKV